ncbi:MAG: T9SS type A sorting domain-containing protein, partial [Candidatus Marinimicrobia bacterium]|nr:T9SS type A sorting domain-containing protein [Candidatus Neomarinimicrobiota bacterium]
MKLKLLLIILCTFIFLLGQTDLIYYTGDYDRATAEAYYSAKETEFKNDIISGDSALYNRGHTGLAFLNLFHSETEFDSIHLQIGDNFRDLGNYYEQAIDSSLSILFWLQSRFTQCHRTGQMIDTLIGFLESEHFQNLKNNRDIMEFETYNFFYNTDYILAEHGNQAGDYFNEFINHMDTVFANESEFLFVLENRDYNADYGYPVLDTTIIDTTILTINRQVLKSMENFTSLMESGANSWADGWEMLLNLEDYGNDTSLAVSEMVAATQSWQKGMDTLQNMINNPFFAPMNIDSALLQDVDSVLAEAEQLLNGKIYMLDSSTNFTIKPVQIIKNIESLGKIALDMYKADDITTYSFGGIFPNGVPGIEYVKADLIIKTNASDEDIRTYLYNQKLAARDSLALNPGEPNFSAIAGAAMLQETARQFGYNLEQTIKHIDRGRLDSAFMKINQGDLNYSDQLDSIYYYFTNLEYSNEVMICIFTNGVYTDLYDPVIEDKERIQFIYPFAPADAAMYNRAYAMLSYSMKIVEVAMDTIMQNMNKYVDTYLDPNELDFSNAEDPMDFINVLKQSNPNFLALTPKGKLKMKELRNEIRFKLGEAAAMMDSVEIYANKLYPYMDDLGMKMDTTSMKNTMTMMNGMVKMMEQDFSGGYMRMNQERMDMSAWFDNPPDNLLTTWEEYMTGVDPTMGGMFPDRVDVDSPAEILPEEFCLHPVYPNPFNPVAHIRFDIPEEAHVKVTIYNINGELVDHLADKSMQPGRIEMEWQARNLSSGIYFAILQVNGQSRAIRKMTLI